MHETQCFPELLRGQVRRMCKGLMIHMVYINFTQKSFICKLNFRMLYFILSVIYNSEFYKKKYLLPVTAITASLKKFRPIMGERNFSWSIKRMKAKLHRLNGIQQIYTNFSFHNNVMSKKSNEISTSYHHIFPKIFT